MPAPPTRFSRQSTRTVKSHKKPLNGPTFGHGRRPSHSKQKRSRRNSLSWYRRRPRFFLALGCFVLVLFGICVALWDVLVLVRFKLRNQAFNEKWVNGCGLRKKPLLFVHSSDEVAVVWESNCDLGLRFNWVEKRIGRDGKGRDILIGSEMLEEEEEDGEGRRAEVKAVEVPDETDTHFLYSTNLKGLRAGSLYTYEIRVDSTPPSSSVTTLKASSKKAGRILARHTFPWVGALKGHDSLLPSHPIHIAAIGDNQFGLKIFHRIVRQLSFWRRFLPKRLRTTAYSRGDLPFYLQDPKGSELRTFTRPTKPHLLLHVGDAVQQIRNLQQWQTDFYDPLSYYSNLGQILPTLYSPGNHDYDPTGEYLYTGGVPSSAQKKAGVLSSQGIGTWHAFSIYRTRWIVLDSNVDPEIYGDNQERWLIEEFGKREWREASLKVVIVHIPPFLEFWDPKAWNEEGESSWGLFVRTRLTPLFHSNNASLVISGHQHAYSRGLLPDALAAPYFTSLTSASLPPQTLLSSLQQRGSSTFGNEDMSGPVYTIIGGAGGTLDMERVEDWGFFEKSVTGRYFWVGMVLEFGILPQDVRKLRKNDERVYKVGAKEGDCEVREERRIDRLGWSVRDLKGREIDSFVIEAAICDGRGSLQ